MTQKAQPFDKAQISCQKIAAKITKNSLFCKFSSNNRAKSCNYCHCAQ